MIEISVDELKANLNEYLQQVEKGEILVIARRGNVLARIVPAGKSLNKRMDRLVEEGVIMWGGKPLSTWEPIAVNNGPELISDLVWKERDSADD
jgi:prevent-host-death family protein